jgi:hypothetical protein
MKGKFNFKLVALCAILSAMLVVPALGQVKEEEGNRRLIDKEQKEKMIKELKLAPDKEKAILAVEDKYARGRKEIIADMKKAVADLQVALASANPDDEKIKKLVRAVTTCQDKMFISFKNQRDKELSLMAPVEQGKYLMMMRGV